MLVYNSIIIQPTPTHAHTPRGRGGYRYATKGGWMHWSTHIKFFLQKGWNLGKKLGNSALGYCSVLILLDL